MAPKLTMEEVKQVIPKKEIFGAGSRTDRTGHGRISERFPLVQKNQKLRRVIMVNNKVPLIAKVCIVVVALLLLPAFVLAAQPTYGFNKGDYEFTLSGSGTSDNDLDNTVFSTSFGLGYFFTDNFEGALRQSVSFNDFPGANGWSGSTSLAVDYHFDLERFQPLIGASAGYIYGNSKSGVKGHVGRRS
jgi:hypothetical protein